MNIIFDIPVLNQIATSLAQLVTIQKARLLLEQKNMIKASDVLLLVQDFNAVTLAKSQEDTDLATANTALATAQANLATLQQTVTELNDPTLASALSAALANAAAATPPANPVVANPGDPTNPLPPTPAAPVVLPDPVPTPVDPNATPVTAVPDPNAPV